MNDHPSASEEEADAVASPPDRKRLRAVLWLLVAVVAAAGIISWFEHSRPPAGAPASYADSVGGPFRLTASDGATVTAKTLAGTPYAIFFGFTRCPDVCPTTLARMARLRSALGEDGMKFRIVFVSVDPEHDTPQDIGRYLDLFGTPILGLTGNKQQLAQIVKDYHVYYEKVPQPDGDYTIDHTAAVYLMDRGGQLQSIIDAQESEASALAKLQRLVG